MQNTKAKSKKSKKKVNANSERVPLVLSQAVTREQKRINSNKFSKQLGIRTTKIDIYRNLVSHVREAGDRVLDFVLEKANKDYERTQVIAKADIWWKENKPAPVAETGETQ